MTCDLENSVYVFDCFPIFLYETELLFKLLTISLLTESPKQQSLLTLKYFTDQRSKPKHFYFEAHLILILSTGS